MAQRTVAVNVKANTASYVAGMGKASAATNAFGGLVRTAITRLLGPAALVGALVRSGQASLKFADEMTKLRTQIGLSNDEVGKLRQSALMLGGATTRGPQELAEATFFVASAGLRGAAATEVLRRSAQLAAIGMGETATIADTLTSAVNAYGEESISAAQASDVLVSAVRLGKAGADELAGSIGKVLPIASAMGVTFDEVGGIIAAMTRTGTDAATASTQLRAIMVSLLKPTDQAAEAMLEMGLSASGLRNTIQEDGLFKALTDIEAATDGSSDKMAELFPNVRALGGAMDLLGPQLEENAALMDEMANSTDVATDAFEVYSKTTRAEIERLSSSFERLLIVSGDRTTGLTNSVVTLTNGFVQGLGNIMMASEDADAHMQFVGASMLTVLSEMGQATAGLDAEQREALATSEEWARLTDELGLATANLTAEQMDNLLTTKDMLDLNDTAALSTADVQLRFRELASALARSGVEQDGVNERAARFNRISAGYSDAAGEAAGATDDFTEALGFTNEELDDMISNIDRARDEKRRLVDPVFDLMRAEEDLAEAQADVNQLMQDSETDSGELSTALVDLQRKHGDYDHALATSEVFMDGYIGELNEMIETGRFSEEQVQHIIDRLGEQGTEMELIDGKVVRTTHIHTEVRLMDFGAEGGGSRPAAARALGGPIVPGRPYLVGEHGPELIVPGRAGNVIPAHQTRAMMEGNSGTGIVIQEYHTHQHVDDQALVAMLEMRQEAGRL